MKGDLMNNKAEKGNPTASREIIDWTRHLSNEKFSYMFDLIKHAIYFSLTIVIIWLMLRFTEHLFQNIPLVIKILIYISEIIIIIHFAKENI